MNRLLRRGLGSTSPLRRPAQRKLMRALANHSKRSSVFSAHEMTHAHPKRHKSVTAMDPAVEAPGGGDHPDTANGRISGRLRITAEVAVSKLFPAGFCWQYASCLAEDWGYGDHDMGFFCIVGLGDFAGVALGHVLFYNTIGRLYLPVNAKHELQVGVFLGSAAFMTGFVWQPMVNACHLLGMGFTPAMVSVGAVGAMWFHVGLRFFREFYGEACGWTGIDESVGMVSDGQLSMAIGCADAAFVGTDLGFSGNWLGAIVGVGDADPMLTGMYKAGTSTFLGFSAGQMIENVAVPRGALWLD